VSPGLSLKVSEPREGQITMRRTGETVTVAPTSPDACHTFPTP
jgi:hypothetical protein